MHTYNTYVYICLSIYLSIYLSFSISLSLYIYIYACMFMCVNKSINKYIYIYICIHIPGAVSAPRRGPKAPLPVARRQDTHGGRRTSCDAWRTADERAHQPPFLPPPFLPPPVNYNYIIRYDII